MEAVTKRIPCLQLTGLLALSMFLMPSSPRRNDDEQNGQQANALLRSHMSTAEVEICANRSTGRDLLLCRERSPGPNNGLFLLLE